jgi:hypothetical protein
VPETLKLIVDGEAAFSLWGDLLWQESYPAIYAEQIWPSPSDKLRYGPKFADSVKKDCPADRIITLNERIDDLARFLEQSTNLKSLDFKKLQGNPLPGITHEMDAWADRGAARLFGYYDGATFVLDQLGQHL